MDEVIERVNNLDFGFVVVVFINDINKVFMVFFVM